MRQVSLWDVDDVDTFGPVSEMTVGPVEQIDVREFCRRWHYSNNGGSALWNYGLYDGDVLVGVVAYNLPTRDACAAVFGEDYVLNVAHMGRLVCADDAPRNSESRLIAGSLKRLAADKPNIWAVLTYAAQDVGHIGYVYQATNAIYTGTSNAEPYYIDHLGKRHSTKVGTRAEGRRLAALHGWTLHKAPPKHRYVYILGAPCPTPRTAPTAEVAVAALSEGGVMSSVCNVWGPDGARCEIRKHHVGDHAGMSQRGEWLQWH